MFIDGVTARVVDGWRARGIDAILIKGPTVAAWLYGDDLVRSYGDSDLFVSPADHAAACATLIELGFEEYAGPGQELAKHTTTWRHTADDGQVDLHHALFGSWVSAKRQWQLIYGRYTEEMRIGGTAVLVPTLPARAMLIALHAAQHSDHDVDKPDEDLRRALAAGNRELWLEAAKLADELDAVRDFAEGLAREPGGEALALSLPAAGAYLRAPSFTRSGVVWVERIASADSGRSRIRLVTDAFFPAPSTLRRWMPLARRGPVGLGAAYVVRAAGLILNAVPVAVTWYRARAR